MVEWVEVRGKTVDVAVAAAMQELSIADREGVDIEVIQEPEKGFLGLGGKDAIVRVKPRSQSRNRKRRRGRGEGEGDRRPAQSKARAPADRATARGDPERAGTVKGRGRPSRPPQSADQRSTRPAPPSGDDSRQRPSNRPGNDVSERESRDNQVDPPPTTRERQG